MFKFSWKRLGMVAGLSLSLVVAGCGSDNNNAADNNNATNNNDSANNEEVDYSNEVKYAITGIEPGAGVVQSTEDAIEEYDNLDGWEVETSSSGVMAAELGSAIDKEEPIIVTGWSPHWKFSKYDLKYLEDPKGVFGDAETINTMVRKGLEDDQPEAYAVLDNFNWDVDAMESVMLEVDDGATPEEAAQAWLDENQDQLEAWTEGVDEVDGEEIELVLVDWDTEVASTNVVKIALESIGYDVTMTPLDNAIMWKAVADGEADAMVAAWLPGTHEEQFETYGDDMIDLGPNLEGAKIGLVVPAYMDIDSIEDLQAK